MNDKPEGTMEELNSERTMEMLAIVEEIEDEAAELLQDVDVDDDTPIRETAARLEAKTARMRQLLGAPGPGKRRKART